MSNKYPVMVDLEVTANTGGRSIANPEIAGGITSSGEDVSITTPVGDKLELHFPKDMMGQEITVECFDKDGSEMKKTIKVRVCVTFCFHLTHLALINYL